MAKIIITVRGTESEQKRLKARSAALGVPLSVLARRLLGLSDMPSGSPEQRENYDIDRGSRKRRRRL